MRGNQAGAKQGPDHAYIRKGRRYSVEGVELRRSCLTAVSNHQQEASLKCLCTIHELTACVQSAGGIPKPAAEKHVSPVAVSEPTAGDALEARQLAQETVEHVLRRGNLDSRRDKSYTSTQQQQNIRRSSVQVVSGANMGVAPMGSLQGASFIKKGQRYSVDGKAINASRFR